MAGHLILSDEDLTSVVQGSWKHLNTLQHYKVQSMYFSIVLCLGMQIILFAFYSINILFSSMN